MIARAVAHDEDGRRLALAARDLHFLVRLVGRDRDVREPERTPFRRAQDARLQALAGAEPGLVELRAEVVVVEDEFFSDQPEGQRDEEKRVGRIVRVHRVEAVPQKNIDAEQEAAGREITVLEAVADEDLGLGEEPREESEIFRVGLLEKLDAPEAIHPHAADHFVRRLAGPLEGEHRHVVAMAGEQRRLIADASVPGVAVLQQHDNSIRSVFHREGQVGCLGSVCLRPGILQARFAEELRHLARSRLPVPALVLGTNVLQQLTIESDRES